MLQSAYLGSTIQTQLPNFARSLTVSLNADMISFYTKKNLMTYGLMLLVEISQPLAPGRYESETQCVAAALSVAEFARHGSVRTTKVATFHPIGMC
jgi:hypothetical protein